ncbi:MAG: hypothetical protein GY762_15095 [Proteobacteria bacterium]|nr:hypothetical protein [Pseudomonadota bacterium]
MIICVIAVFVSLAGAVPKPDGAVKGRRALAEGIRSATGLNVRPDSLVWIGNASNPGEPETRISWQDVLYLASQEKGGPADLYKLEVRLDSESKIFDSKGIRNISRSPLGDDYKIVAFPPYVLVATRVLGQVRSLALLNFEGQKLSRNDGWTLFFGVLARLTDMHETGYYWGIEKKTLQFMHPPEKVQLSSFELAEGDQFSVVWMDRRARRHHAFVNMGSGVADDEELRTTAEVRLPKPVILWLVDTVRSLSFVGPGPIEWAEGRFFALRDRFRRFNYRLFGETELEDVGEIGEAAEPETVFELSPGREVGEDNSNYVWPPPKVKPPVFSRGNKGEGIWVRAMPDFVRTLPEAPFPIYKTFTRPDIMRPYVRVDLFAMDMRQLELHMVGGHEDPRSTTGSVGTGKIPHRKEVLSKLVAAFNGAFKTMHGAYGMMVERDVLLPPREKAATVAALEGGQTAMGSWPEGTPIPPHMVSLRQNLDPLVENGVVNPRRRYLWGFTLSEDIQEMNTVRSGICMTDSGILMYAWGEDLTATTLGIAMNAAGCVYGMHLDMNPLHTAFVYYQFEDDIDLDNLKYKSQLARTGMRYSPDRYINGAPKDFFFLTLRDRGPGPGWTSDGLAQPAPAYVPAVFKLTAGTSTLIAVDTTRVTAHLVPGTVPFELVSSRSNDPEDGRDLLVAMPLGEWSSGRGQLVNGAVVATLESGRATLGVREDHSIAIGAWPLGNNGQSITNDAVQSQWISSVASSDREVVACGMLGSAWLIIGQGPAQELTRVMEKQKVVRLLSFNLPNSGGGGAVRSESGMVRMKDNEKWTPDNNSAALHILAKPRPLGATRLETVLAKGEQESKGR